MIEKIPEMLTCKELAQRTNVPLHFVRRLVKSGAVPSVRSGRKYLISLQRFCAFLEGSADAQ